MVNIVSDNLIIRMFTINDVHVYYVNNNEENIKQFMPDHSHESEEQAHEEVISFISNYNDKKMPYHFPG